MKYYYLLHDSVHHTDSIDKLLSLITTNTITMINDKQTTELKLSQTYIPDLKKSISLYDEKVPLYDIKSNRIYLIHKDNVYSRIFNDDYRFVDEHFYQDLINIENPSEYDKKNINILSFYDMDILYESYLKIFYESFVLDSYITHCKRPSFNPGMDHIRPYYKSTEIYYLAYDWNLTDHVTLQPKEIRDLCKKIQKYDIPSQILLDHQLYIYNNKAIGLVKHYSLFGSYFINRYLRHYKCCIMEDPDKLILGTRNLVLENQIQLMINLIKSAPAFSKNYTVYRFIDDDSYLSHLKVGDVYEDPSFLSTTRDPVYYQNNYSFGYILIKIKLPKSIPGIGLCIESYSNFPEEQEIILPPTSQYRLIKITEQTDKYHDVIKLNKRVQKKYEFELINNKPNITLNMNPNMKIPNITNIDFKNLRTSDDILLTSISDRLNNFTRNYLNDNSQFMCTIGKNDYIFVVESYNSTSAYKQFFWYGTDSGLMCYSSNPTFGNINIMLELGTVIHVNYYFKYSVSDSSQQVDLTRSEWTDWLSLFSFIIGSESVIIHSNYILGKFKSDDTLIEKQNKTRYTYSDNIYQYLKNNKKMFDNVIGITPNFDYEQLDILSVSYISDIIYPTDKDELYQIASQTKLSTVKDFYVYIIENYPQYINLMQTKMATLYSSPEINPFNNISYTLDSWTYLYEKHLINHLPSKKDFSIHKGSFKNLIGDDKKITQFKNRLRSYLLK